MVQVVATNNKMMSDRKIVLKFTQGELAAIIETADLSNDSVTGWIYGKIMTATNTNDEARFAIRRKIIEDFSAKA